MQNNEIVQRFASASEKGDETVLDGILADDFEARWGATASPFGKKDYIRVVQGLRQAMPDIRYQVDAFEEGTPCCANLSVEGTFTNALDLTGVGLPRAEPNRKRIRIAGEPAQWSIAGGRVAEYVVEAGPDGGFAGILKQMGAGETVHQVASAPRPRPGRSGQLEYATGGGPPGAGPGGGGAPGTDPTKRYEAPAPKNPTEPPGGKRPERITQAEEDVGAGAAGEEEGAAEREGEGRREG